MRITCLLPASLGDFILTTPSLKSLQNYFPREEVNWILPRSLLDAAQLFPLTARRLTLEESAAAQDPDITICFPPATRYYLMARRLGGKIRVGYTHEKMFIPRLVSHLSLTQRWVCPSDSPLHELEAYGKILSLIDVPFESSFPAPQIFAEKLPQSHSAFPEIENRRTLIIHLGKRWTGNPLHTLRKFTESRPDIQLVALFSKEEAGQARRLIDEVNLPNLVTPEPGSLAGILSILRRSRLFIGVDGGLIHLAAAAGIPVLAFYPHHDFKFRVKKWHPWSVPYQAAPLNSENVNRIPEFAVNLLERVKNKVLTRERGS